MSFKTKEKEICICTFELLLRISVCRLTRTSPTQPRSAEESIAGMRADADVESGFEYLFRFVLM